jgi:ATP-dependent RNA helicase RhlE
MYRNAVNDALSPTAHNQLLIFMTFEQLDLAKPLLEALAKKGYTQPTPIQEQSIPHILAGKDIFGCAQTGTGKTAAFALPILQLLATDKTTDRRDIQALILAPTRELALQISESFGAYGQKSGLKHAVIFGGVNQNPQIQTIRNGVNILRADCST